MAPGPASRGMARGRRRYRARRKSPPARARCASAARWAGEDHVEGEEEEEDPARYPERGDADAQGFEQDVAGEREDEQDDRAEESAPDRRLPLAFLRVAAREGGEDRSRAPAGLRPRAASRTS